MIVVYPTEGLCNKLRVVFSYYQKALEKKEELVVIWDDTEQCNGYFLDYFEPVKNIRFVKNNKEAYPVDYKGYQCCEGYRPYTSKYQSNFFEKLVPLPYLISVMDERRKLLKDKYIAVHIRRTDHSDLARENERYTHDNEFHEFINENGTYNVYLATDNLQTQKAFLEHHSERIKCIKLADGGDRVDAPVSRFASLINPFNQDKRRKPNLRKTSLEHAIIDLYMCIYADKFMGSGYSSFSNFITYMRERI